MPETKVCCRCKQELPRKNFSKRTTAKDGLDYSCKLCNKNRKITPGKRRQYRLSFIHRVLSKFKEHKETLGGCIYCGESDIDCLDFHHVLPNKIECVSNLIRKGLWQQALIEIDKCVLLCANCHRKLHKGTIILDNLKAKKWGYHLIVDAGDCDESINSPIVIQQFLQTLVAKLDMHPIGGPVIYYVDSEEGKGVSGVQIITTSTLTFHGDANGNRIFVDIFSCKEYSADTVLAYIQELFNPKTIKHRFLYRDVP